MVVWETPYRRADSEIDRGVLAREQVKAEGKVKVKAKR